MPLQARINQSIRIHNAREHNLKSIDVEIPRNEFTVVTGVSGSGKSTLAFDILFAEGQRRYLESLNAYARQFVQGAARPDVDAIFGIPPTVAIEQRTSRGGSKSTVATLTEIYHFLRLLYVKLGTQHCPDCNGADRAAERGRDRRAPAARIQGAAHRPARPARRRTARATTPISPSGRAGRVMNSCAWTASSCRPAKWPRLSRFQEHTLELPVADLRIAADNEAEIRRALARALEFGKGVVHVIAGLDRLEEAKRNPGRREWKWTSRSASSPRSAPAPRAGAASPSSTRGFSRSTPSTAGARGATARA